MSLTPFKTIDKINKHVEKKTQAAEQAARVGATSDYLPLDTRREDFYYPGPPEMVYCVLPSQSTIRLILSDRAAKTNDVKANPWKYMVRLNIPYYKLPANTSIPIGVGELVEVVPFSAPPTDLQPALGQPLMGSPSSSTTVKVMQIGDSSLVLGENGELQIWSGGKLVSTFHADKVVNYTPTNSTTFFGSEQRMIFKDNIAHMIPRAFVPPFSTPNYLPDFAVLGDLGELRKEVLGFLRAVRGV